MSRTRPCRTFHEGVMAEVSPNGAGRPRKVTGQDRTGQYRAGGQDKIAQDKTGQREGGERKKKTIKYLASDW